MTVGPWHPDTALSLGVEDGCSPLSELPPAASPNVSRPPCRDGCFLSPAASETSPLADLGCQDVPAVGGWRWVRYGLWYTAHADLHFRNAPTFTLKAFATRTTVWRNRLPACQAVSRRQRACGKGCAALVLGRCRSAKRKL